MKCIGVKEELVEYNLKKEDYIVLIRKSASEIALLKTDEFHLATREEVEKLGYSLDNVVLFSELHSYEIHHSMALFFETSIYYLEVDELKFNDSLLTMENLFEKQGKLGYEFENYILEELLKLDYLEHEDLEERVLHDVKNRVTDARYRHVLAVTHMAELLAKNYHVYLPKARLSALAHDVTKGFTDEELFRYANEHQLELTDDDWKSPKVLHGPVGADYMKRNYQFSEDMCDSIYYHTTGHANMTVLEKILLISDKIDGTRPYKEVKELKRIAFVDLDQAIQTYFDRLIINLISQKMYVHPLALETRNDVVIKNQQKNKRK